MRAATLLLAAYPCLAQDDILKRPAVAKALAWIRANDQATLDKQVQIAEIPAPTFHETERAKFMQAEFLRVGLKDVEIDAQGNVLGWRPGRSERTLVIAAHLDISFAPGVNTKVRKEGKRWHGPGLADDSRGLAAILAIVEAMNVAGLETQRSLLFVANVGEEGLGDLNGVRYLFQKGPHRNRLDAFISIDGTNPARITNGGVGVKRYRVTFKSPGGHSYGNFGRPSAAHAMGRAIGKLADMDVPAKPKTTYNVGRVSGGTAVNAIAEETWMEVDLRSESLSELDKIEVKLFEAIRTSVEEENARRAASGVKVTSDSKLVSNRPGGLTADTSPLVKAAQWAAVATGHEPTLGYGSTDSNLPISLGIPAVTMGGGGKSDNHHSLDEWFEPEETWKGPQTVLLTILAYDAVPPVAWNFEGGSLGRVESAGADHLRVHLAGQADQDGRNRQANWYYFRVDGKRGREVKVDLTSLPGEYNYKLNRGAVTKDTVPVWSEDNRTWKHFATTEFHDAEPSLRLRFTPTREQFWIAHVPPYTGVHLGELFLEFRKNPWLRVESIGKSLGGRAIPLLTITDTSAPDANKRVVWLMFRQHSWETGSSWAGEGAIRFLLSDSVEAQRIRRAAIFKIFPLCDPDGTASGAVRFNARGFDLNRNWDVEDPVNMPEINAQRKSILDWVDSGKRLDLFLSVHNTETAEYLDGPPGSEPAITELGERFFRLLKQHSTFAPTRPFTRTEPTTTAGKAGRMNVSQGLYHYRKLPAFLMEQMISNNPRLGRLPTIEDRKKFGEGLARAAFLAVE